MHRLYFHGAQHSFHRLGEVDKTCQGFERRLGIALDQTTHGVRSLLQARVHGGGQLVFEVTPQAFNRVEFRTVGGQRHRGLSIASDH